MGEIERIQGGRLNSPTSFVFGANFSLFATVKTDNSKEKQPFS